MNGFSMPPRWVLRANCAGTDPESFYPHRGQRAAAAIRVCRRCPVLAECLESALEQREEGVWGGTTERQRQRIRAQRRRAAKQSTTDQ